MGCRFSDGLFSLNPETREENNLGLRESLRGPPFPPVRGLTWRDVLFLSQTDPHRTRRHVGAQEFVPHRLRVRDTRRSVSFSTAESRRAFVDGDPKNLLNAPALRTCGFYVLRTISLVRPPAFLWYTVLYPGRHTRRPEPGNEPRIVSTVDRSASPGDQPETERLRAWGISIPETVRRDAGVPGKRRGGVPGKRRGGGGVGTRVPDRSHLLRTRLSHVRLCKMSWVKVKVDAPGPSLREKERPVRPSGNPTCVHGGVSRRVSRSSVVREDFRRRSTVTPKNPLSVTLQRKVS